MNRQAVTKELNAVAKLLGAAATDYQFLVVLRRAFRYRITTQIVGQLLFREERGGSLYLDDGDVPITYKPKAFSQWFDEAGAPGVGVSDLVTWLEQHGARRLQPRAPAKRFPTSVYD